MLELRHLTKSYGPTRALVDFSLAVSPGTVVSLIGENGAGKSTVARLLAGAQTPDRGTISLQGEALRLSSPRDARRHGIGFIPQELAPVPTLSLAENLFLGDLPMTRGLVSQRRLEVEASRELASLGFEDVDMTKTAAGASLPELQLVEVAKAVRRRSSVIVFDEPTASLSEAETRILHQIIRGLSGRGVAIVYISHRMDEVFAFSSRLCVLRNGHKIAEHDTDSVSRDVIVSEMVGHAVVAHETTSDGTGAGQQILSLERCRRSMRPELRDVSVALQEGEVVGLYGVRGAGAEAVAGILGGRLRAEAGTLSVRGRVRAPLPRTPRGAKALGIRYIPADRKTDGLALRLSVADNISLPNHSLISRRGFINRRRQRELVDRSVAALGITLSSPFQRVEELSGGNQQKVLLAGRLAQPGSVLVLEEPTRGVDIGARSDIHKTLRGLARSGVGIIVASTDVEEIVSVADRVLVLRDGRIAAELVGATKTQAHAVGAAMRDPVRSPDNRPRGSI